MGTNPLDGKCCLQWKVCRGSICDFIKEHQHIYWNIRIMIRGICLAPDKVQDEREFPIEPKSEPDDISKACSIHEGGKTGEEAVRTAE